MAEDAIDHYDIIIAGAGLSGLTLAVELAGHPAMAGQRFCLIDRDDKTKNDRTWCFWATAAACADLPPVVHRSWKHCNFFSPIHSETLVASDYTYNMVRGRDFYQWAKGQIAALPNVEWVQDNIVSIDSAQGIVCTQHRTFKGTWVLNSAILPFPVLPNLAKDDFVTPFSTHQPTPEKGYIYLLQHFKGWIIKTPEPVFDTATVTMMDFRIEQQDDTRFVYVLPFSSTEALVEFTVFSPRLLPENDYVEALKDYMSTFLTIKNYEVLEEEFGVIPMTDFPFTPLRQGREIRIGTAGGFVKASSGYAFRRTQQRIKAFAQAWATTGAPNPDLLRSEKRFRVYDSIFLRALNDHLLPAHKVFGYFFKNLGGTAVFRFLDEDTRPWEDIRALSSVPIWPFIKAAFRQLLRLPYV